MYPCSLRAAWVFNLTAMWIFIAALLLAFILIKGQYNHERNTTTNDKWPADIDRFNEEEES